MGAIAAERGLSTQDRKVTYLRTQREKRSHAFPVEYDTPPTQEEIGRELTSYLAEYRLQIPRYSYELIFGRGLEGDQQMRLRPIDRGEPIGNKTKRVIEERTSWFEPTAREKAEDQAVDLLDKKLQALQTGDTVIWASPPGPKEQGYGDYGFLFVGRATKLDNGESHLAMTAVRIENPREEVNATVDETEKKDPWVTQVNKTLSVLTGNEIIHTTREQILGEPVVVQRDLSLDNVDRVVKQHFAFQFDPEAQANSESIIAEMKPLIDEATSIMLLGTKEQKQKTLHALENYALKLKVETNTEKKGEHVIFRTIKQSRSGISGIIDTYGYEPPRVQGSCGSSDNVKSSKDGNTVSSVTSGECPSIKCGGNKDGEPCDWEASASEAAAVQSGSLTACPECGWKP